MSERLLREFRERAEHLVPMPDLDELQRRGTRLRRVRIAAGAAVVASALAIGGVVVTNSIDDKNAVAPATGGAEDPPAPNGAMYLPPEGATPSTPASGELVASMETRFGAGVYVYADGRLIWKRHHGRSPNRIGSSSASPPKASSWCGPRSCQPGCSTPTGHRPAASSALTSGPTATSRYATVTGSSSLRGHPVKRGSPSSIGSTSG